MFTVKVYRGLDVVEGAKLALKHRLYVSGWCLSGELKSMIRSPRISDGIALGLLDGVPVSIVLHDAHQYMAFCRKALRNNGYASQCFQKLNVTGKSAGGGIDGSDHFWRKNGITPIW